MTLQRVCSAGEVLEGKAVSFDVDGLDVALVRVGAEIFAIEDECSHAAVALSEGDVEGCTIECWMHGSRFDLRTGEPLGLPATVPVPVFPVRVEGDDVLIELNTEIGDN